MDRKSIIILVVSFALLILWYPLTQKLYPTKRTPSNTNIVATATNAGSNTAFITTNAAPSITQSSVLGAPEQTLVMTNGRARYTFTSYGGALKMVELVGIPAVTCQPKGAEPAWAALNVGAKSPVLALADPSALGDGVFSLIPTSTGIRAEKQLTNNVVWIKTFEPSSNNLLKATVRIENRSSAPVTLPAQHWTAGTATPLGDKEAETMRGIYWSNGEKAEHVDSTWFANRGFLSCVTGANNPRTEYTAGSSNVAWTAVHNQFFVLAVLTKEPAHHVLAHPVSLTAPGNTPRTNAAAPGGIDAEIVYPESTIASNGSLERTFHIFAGPREYKTLQRIGLAFNNNLDAIMGFGWFGFFAKLLLLSMNGLHALGLNYALAIIAITVIIKVLFWPLTQASTRSMKRMQKLQPQMRAIQEKFKDDPVKMNRKTMEFMREHKVNPVGGCLPMALQVPVFIGFYQMIQSAIELRGEQFLWACDLSKPDTVYILPGFNFPINPLPLVMGVTMLWQARLTPPSPGMDPVQQKVMRYMPLMFLVILYNFSAGLTLYWTVQNLLTIAQMKLTRTKEEEPPATPAKPPFPVAVRKDPKKKKNL